MPKYPPDIGTIRAIAARRMSWEIAFKEWIDNAFDKNASTVTFTFERNKLTIHDDGEGTAKLHDIVQIGKHAESGGVGQYGMGGTESLLRAGGERSSVSITSTHGNTRRHLNVNWHDYAESGWELPEAFERDATAAEQGTSIVITGMRARAPNNWDSITSELGYVYSHAIRKLGKRISFHCGNRKIVVKPWNPPERDPDAPEVNTVIKINDLEVKISAGVIRHGVKNVKRGLTYWYGYRVIIGETNQGCGSHSPTRVSGFIELSDSRWKKLLTLNKDGLVSGEDELFDRIEKTLEPVLVAADAASSIFAYKELTEKLEGYANSFVRSSAPDAKAKREKPATPVAGAIVPTRTGGRHQRAEKQQSGKTFRSRVSSGIKIDYQELGGVSAAHFAFPVLTLNLSNPFVKQARDEQDAQVLMVVISAILSDHLSKSDDRNPNQMTLEPKPFLDLLGEILSSCPTLDGIPVMA